MFASTGQEFLGYNMFQYCKNNPVNLLDENGFSGIWFYLKELHKWGYIHACVQDHITDNNGGISKELWLTREIRLPRVGFVEIVVGRADLRDASGAVWEVKHAGQDAAGRNALATMQASSYIGAKCARDGVQINGLGNANAFSGQFIINYVFDGIYESYEVSYDTPSAGVVLYNVRQIEYQEDAQYYLVEQPAPVPADNTEEQPAAVPLMVPLGVPAVGYSGSYGYGPGFGNKNMCNCTF